MVDYQSSSLKRAKKQKIPKRGPGVAELEKILREQETKDDHNVHADKVPSSSISSLVPPPPNGGGNGGGSSKGVYIDGSGVYLPENTLLPISWKDHPHQHHDQPATSEFSFPTLVPNGSADHTQMMKFFSSSPTLSSTAGVHNHHLEPPSNQKHFGSAQWHEGDKVLGSKRPRPNFPIENWRPPPPVPPRYPYKPICPKITMVNPSSSSSNNPAFIIGLPSNSPLNHGNFPRGNGNHHHLPIGPSTTTLLPSTQNCQPEVPKFPKQFPFQENSEGSLLQRSSSAAEPKVPVHNKGFHDFFVQLEEQQQQGGSTEATLSLKNAQRRNEEQQQQGRGSTEATFSLRNGQRRNVEQQQQQGGSTEATLSLRNSQRRNEEQQQQQGGSTEATLSLRNGQHGNEEQQQQQRGGSTDATLSLRNGHRNEKAGDFIDLDLKL